MFQATIQMYRQAYKGLSPNTWWLSLVMLINRSGTMVVPFMTMYLTQYLGVGIGKATIVMSLFGAGSVVGALLGGRITDRIGFMPVQLFTLFFGGLLFMVLGQMRSYDMICLVAFTLSMVNEAFRPANSVAIAHYSTEQNRTRSYSLNRLSVNLGWAVGGALGGFIAAHDYKWLFWVDGITNICAAFLLFAVLRNKGGNRINKAVNGHKKEAVRPAYRDRIFVFFVGLQIVFAACFFQMFSILPVFYKAVLKLSENHIGLVMAFNGILIALIEMVVVFRLEGRAKHLHLIALGVFFVGLSYAMLNLPYPGGLALAFLSMLAITIGEILSMPFMNSFWVTRTLPENRGQYAGLFSMAWSVAQIAGPLAGGQLVESFGYPFLWWGLATVCCCLSVLYLLLHRHNETPMF